MPKPPTHEHEVAIYPVAGDFTRVRYRSGKFVFGFRRQHFVGIEDEDPFVSKRKILQSPILFFWPGPVELKLHDMGAVFPCNLKRAVRALRIDHEDLVGPFHGIQTFPQIRGFVLDGHENRDRHPGFLTHPVMGGVLGRRTRHGLPAAMTFGGTSFVTTEQAPITLPAPIVTPGMTKARAPMKASSPIAIVAVTSGISGRAKSCVPVLR